MATISDGEQETHRVPMLQPADLGSIPYRSSHRTNVSTQSISINIIQGPGNISSYNPIITKVISGDVRNELDTVLIKILTILESQHVSRAVFGAQIEMGCMEGTRVQVLRDIEDWIMDLTGPQIFWLAGMAGTGKSAIAWTVCSQASKNPDILLGGSFFCSRSTGLSTQRDVRCIAPTLAILLARQSLTFGKALAAELAKDPDVLHQQVDQQVEKLLYRPLLALKDSSIPILFVIDALDECSGQLTSNGAPDDAETHRIVSDMLEALVAFSRATVKVPVKFLVTSRPETHIRDTHISHAAFSMVLQLHTVDKQQVADDIRLYISNRLYSTPILRALFTDNDVNALVRFCDGFFIVAATALEHALCAGADVSVERFKSLLNTSKEHLPVGATGPLDSMYRVILEDAVKPDVVETSRLQNLLRLLSALLSVRMTLSVAALADIMGQTRGDLRATISRVHAVIHVPDDDHDASLRPLHASFSDYLFGRASSRFRIAESLGHDALARGCLHVMEMQLRFNISQSRSSFEQKSSATPHNIPLALEYACLQWIYHVDALLISRSQSGRNISSFVRARFQSWFNAKPLPSLQSEMDGKVSDVFRPRLLFWLEVMSALGQVQRAAAMLAFAATMVETKALSQYLRDANSFVASSVEAIERSAPHIYISALPFAHRDSLVYQEFAPLCTGLVSVSLIGVAHHAGRLVMTLNGHESGVNSVAYCSDGSLLASGSTDGTVRIWDMRTGEETMAPLYGDDSAVLSIAFAPDAGSLASGTEGSIVCVWPILPAPADPQKLRGHSAAVSSVTFSPDGFRLASASMDKTVSLWNAKTCQRLAVLRGHTAEVHAVAFTPDSLTLVSASEDQTLQLWDVVKGRPTYASPHRHGQPIRSVCLLADGQTIAAGCGNDIILCKLQTGRKSRTVPTASGPIRSVQSSPNSQALVSVHDRSVCYSTLPRLTARSSTVILDSHTDHVRVATFAPSGLYLALASDDHTVRIWSVNGKSDLLHLSRESDGVDADAASAGIMSDARVLTGHTSQVFSVAASTDGTLIVSGSRDYTIRVWDVRTGNPKFPPLLGHTNSVHAVDISSDNSLIASSGDRTVRLWDLRTGGAKGPPMQGHTEAIRAVAFSPDARWLASGSDDKTVRIWNVQRRLSWSFDPMTCNGCVKSTLFSPTGRLIAAGDDSGRIYLWDATNGQPARQPIRSGTQHVNCIAFSPDGARIVSGDYKKLGPCVRVWSISSGEQVLELGGHTNGILSVAYSFDGRFIASTGWDHTIRLWNADTGVPIATLSEHSEAVQSVAFAANGRFIVSGSDDKTIRIWNLTDAALADIGSNGEFAAALYSGKSDNGWLTGPSGELLLWLPSEYRKKFPKLRFDRCGVEITIDSSGWHRGESWSSCWRNNPVEPAPPAM